MSKHDFQPILAFLIQNYVLACHKNVSPKECFCHFLKKQHVYYNLVSKNEFCDSMILKMYTFIYKNSNSFKVTALVMFQKENGLPL